MLIRSKNAILNLASALSLVLIVVATDAAAQSTSEMRRLRDDIIVLEKQLAAVQRAVFDGRDGSYVDGGAGPVTGPTSSSVRPADRGLVADLSARMGQIETQLRQMNGRLEEMNHRQTIAQREMDAFRARVEGRLRVLEGGSAPPPSAGSSAALEPLDEVAVSGSRGVASTPAPAQPVGTPEEQYAAAFALLRRSAFDEAEGAFTRFLTVNEGHALSGNAQYWLGETYYVRRDYPRAAAAFLKGFQDYRDGAKGADSLLKLGMSLGALDQKEDACAAFSELDRAYPNATDTIQRRLSEEKSRAGC